MKLSDADHPLVQGKAGELISLGASREENLKRIFLYVRDEIRFGFPPEWDKVRASGTIGLGIGYCNTKATLFNALCRVAGIPSRIHAGLININILKGIFPAYAFPIMPGAGGHSWIEVEINGEWIPVDSYINDKLFYDSALKLLQSSGRKTGYSISMEKGPASCEFNFGEKGFVHMGAVVEDHGVWDDFADYMASDKYLSLSGFKLKVFQSFTRTANRNIIRLRAMK
ncbi:MAG: transglutaminase-like domain-containing protein [Bacteroidales bacterium]|nr:transglutaminase-like domain-containing protein [Bacteroidales bacterium]